MKKDYNISDDEIALFRQAVEDIMPYPSSKAQPQLDNARQQSEAEEVFAQHFNLIEKNHLPVAGPSSESINNLAQKWMSGESHKVEGKPLEVEHIREVNADEGLYYSQPGIQKNVMKRLKRGQLTNQDRIDLHGINIRDAAYQMDHFIDSALRRGLTSLMVIHGKNHGQIGRRPVIKNWVNQYLRHRPEVLAFSSALPKEGGTGALYVLLKSNSKTP